MNIQEILKKAKEHGAEAVRSALEELRQENQTITAEARAAYDAYFADVRQREAKIRQKVEALGQERDTLSEKILAMRPSLVAATVEGNTDMVSRIQSDMADIEAQKAALTTQIELLSEAQVPGSAELFQAADSKLKELRAANERYRAAVGAIHDFAGEQLELWERIEDDTASMTKYSGLEKNRGGTVSHAEKLYEHFQQN